MRDDDLPPPVLPWWLITLGTLGILGLYVVFVLTTTGQQLDNRLMERLRVDDQTYGRLVQILQVVGPRTMVVLSVLISLAGLVRGWGVALGAGAGAVLCLGLPQLLKSSLDRPQLADFWPMANSLPSGHTAAVAAAAVALLLVVPRDLRSTVLLLGTLATAAMGVLVVVLGHHRASDAVASLGVGMIGWGVGLLIQGRTAARHRPAQLTRSNTAASP